MYCTVNIPTGSLEFTWPHECQHLYSRNPHITNFLAIFHLFFKITKLKKKMQYFSDMLNYGKSATVTHIGKCMACREACHLGQFSAGSRQHYHNILLFFAYLEINYNFSRQDQIFSECLV